MEDADFTQTGLKAPSVIRATRLAIVAAGVLQGAIGSLARSRLELIRRNIAIWIADGYSASVPSATGVR